MHTHVTHTVLSAVLFVSGARGGSRGGFSGGARGGRGGRGGSGIISTNKADIHKSQGKKITFD